MKSLVLAALMLPAMAFADWQLTAGTTAISGVNIAKSATVTLKDTTFELTTVGAGLRNKVVIFNVPVYVTQLLMGDAAKFAGTAEQKVASLATQPAMGIRLTMVRDVPATTMMSAFQDAFDVNKVDLNNADVVKFLNIVKTVGDARTGASYALAILRNADGTETIGIENTAGGSANVDVYGAGMGEKILSIWLGVPADSGLGKLKTALLSGQF